MQANKYEMMYSNVQDAKRTCDNVPIEKIIHLISNGSMSVAQIREKIYPTLTKDDWEFKHITGHISSFLTHLKEWYPYHMEIKDVRSKTPIIITKDVVWRVDEDGNQEFIEAFDKDGNFIDAILNPKFNYCKTVDVIRFQAKRNIYPTIKYYHLLKPIE